MSSTSSDISVNDGKKPRRRSLPWLPLLLILGALVYGGWRTPSVFSDHNEDMHDDELTTAETLAETVEAQWQDTTGALDTALAPTLKDYLSTDRSIAYERLWDDKITVICEAVRGSSASGLKPTMDWLGADTVVSGLLIHATDNTWQQPIAQLQQVLDEQSTLNDEYEKAASDPTTDNNKREALANEQTTNQQVAALLGKTYPAADDAALAMQDAHDAVLTADSAKKWADVRTDGDDAEDSLSLALAEYRCTVDTPVGIPEDLEASSPTPAWWRTLVHSPTVARVAVPLFITDEDEVTLHPVGVLEVTTYTDDMAVVKPLVSTWWPSLGVIVLVVIWMLIPSRRRR